MDNPYSVGSSIYLRAPTMVDVEGAWHEWFSDPETTLYLADRYWPNMVELQRDFFTSIKNDSSRLVLSVVDKETNLHIGVCSLSAINWVHRYADITLVIGDKRFKKGQAAIEVIDLLLEIAFFRLNLLNLKGGYVSTNILTPMLMKLYQFEICGVYKKLINFRGNYVDLVNVQLKREVWIKRQQKVSQNVI